jgi:sterol desaturase/sphingolipid hydroxylase (fatty acid hydroxylase superfamily)
MDIDLDTGKLIVFIGGLLLFLGLESLFPKRAWQGRRGRRLLFHVGVAALNTVTVRVLIFVPLLLWLVFVEEQGWGLSRWLGLDGWLEILASVIVLDLFDYFWHRANHRISWLWRFHKAHHADTDMDTSTALRFHPGELLLSAFAKGIWVLLWGPTAIAWFAFEALVSLCAQFHHSNMDFPDAIERQLSKILVTPRYHAAHHAVDRHFGDANFCTIFSFWDRLFGSYAAPQAGGLTTLAPGQLGLPEDRELAFSAKAWLLEPFTPRNLHLPAANSSENS